MIHDAKKIKIKLEALALGMFSWMIIISKRLLKHTKLDDLNSYYFCLAENNKLPIFVKLKATQY